MRDFLLVDAADAQLVRRQASTAELFVAYKEQASAWPRRFAAHLLGMT
jgi:hypothetical protein